MSTNLNCVFCLVSNEKQKGNPQFWRKGVVSLTPLLNLLLGGQLHAACISEEKRPDNTIISQSQVLWCQNVPSEAFQTAWLLLIIHNAFLRYNYLLWRTTWWYRTKQVCFLATMSSVVRGRMAVLADDCTKGQWHYSLLTLLQSWVSGTWMPCLLLHQPGPAKPTSVPDSFFTPVSCLSSSKCQSSLEFLPV